jgi:hypothetical protein
MAGDGGLGEEKEREQGCESEHGEDVYGWEWRERVQSLK